MRLGIWQGMAAIVLTALGLSSAARADTVLSEVSGNWAGTSGQGFDFRAILSEAGGETRLQIWQGMNGIVPGGAAELDLHPAVYRDNIIAGDRQGLQVIAGPEATVLRILTESEDEQYGFREAVDVQFIDFQFTVIAYAVDLTEFASAEGNYSCHVDLRANTRVVNGVTESLPDRPAEADNLSGWGPDAALTKGLCPAPG